MQNTQTTDAAKPCAIHDKSSDFETELIASVSGLLDTIKHGKAHTLRSTTIELPAPLPNWPPSSLPHRWR